ILRYSSEESRVFSNFFLFSSLPFRRCCCQLIVGQWVRIIGASQISASIYFNFFSVRSIFQQNE
ncbi:hypothetical protein ACTR59_003270, partial [Proteus mirabilis]|uniref:hypothetical protein n=1 Tax=Proteus mirabilis TaxID=584 RepID=UPI0034D77552